MVICIAEDRQSEEIAVQLLLLSLAKHCPHVPVQLFFPPASDRFRQWLTPFPQVCLRTKPFARASEWNVKPYALLTLLREGHEQVWWIDSDIILSRDFRSTIGPLSDSTLVITEEALYGCYGDESYRARAWGFPVGRILPFNLNTGVIRVTQAHISLLQRWQKLLESEPYRKAQRLPFPEKPFHLYGDQDVLTALLASQEFADLPLRILKRGKDIIQYFGPAGFTLQERLLSSLNGLPPFIHSQRKKPWQRSNVPPNWRNLRQSIDYARLELSPYNHVASSYQHAVDADMSWLNCNSRLGKLLSAANFGNPALAGWPLAIAYSLIRLYKQLADVNDEFDPQRAYLQARSTSQADVLSMPQGR